MLGALTLFFELRAHLGEGGRWFARALGADGAPSSIRARALWGAAHVAGYGGDFVTASTRAAQALAISHGLAAFLALVIDGSSPLPTTRSHSLLGSNSKRTALRRFSTTPLVFASRTSGSQVSSTRSKRWRNLPPNSSVC